MPRIGAIFQDEGGRGQQYEAEECREGCRAQASMSTVHCRPGDREHNVGASIWLPARGLSLGVEDDRGGACRRESSGKAPCLLDPHGPSVAAGPSAGLLAESTPSRADGGG